MTQVTMVIKLLMLNTSSQIALCKITVNRPVASQIGAVNFTCLSILEESRDCPLLHNDLFGCEVFQNVWLDQIFANSAVVVLYINPVVFRS